MDLIGKRKILNSLATAAFLLIGMVVADALGIDPDMYRVYAGGVGVAFVGYQAANVASKKINKNGGVQ
jgi:small neutral amino acid transporter SnatA (MarC family)